MWKHDCKVERSLMEVEDNKECNWCGRELEDETSEFGKLGLNEFPDDEVYTPWQEGELSFDTVEATKETLEWNDARVDIIGQNGNDGEHYEEDIFKIEVVDNPDSTSSVTMELDDETLTMLMKQGLQYLIDEMRMTVKVMVLAPNEFEGEAGTWELSDDDRNALFHFGFIYALKMGMKEN